MSEDDNINKMALELATLGKSITSLLGRMEAAEIETLRTAKLLNSSILVNLANDTAQLHQLYVVLREEFDAAQIAVSARAQAMVIEVNLRARRLETAAALKAHALENERLTREKEQEDLVNNLRSATVAPPHPAPAEVGRSRTPYAGSPTPIPKGD